VTSLRAGRFEIRVPAEARDFSLLQNGHTVSVAHPAACSMNIVGSFSGLRRPGCEADHSIPCSADIRN